MQFKKALAISAVLACGWVQAESAPNYSFLQVSAEKVKQHSAGVEGFSDTGFGIDASWQFAENWFIAADWQRFAEKYHFSDAYAGVDYTAYYNNKNDIVLKRYYVGAGYILSLSDSSNLSFAGYIGTYESSNSYEYAYYENDILEYSGAGRYNSKQSSIKTEVTLRKNTNDIFELAGRVHVEYLNAVNNENWQYGLTGSALYHLGEHFALSAELGYGKWLGEMTSSMSAGLRYHF